MSKKLQAIGLTDFYFKELCLKRKDYLVFILNGICNLNLKESDIEFTDTEERDLCTLKTINYDIKVISDVISIDIEAQISLNSKEKNENGEYIYDISRSFYYLSALHSRGYDYKEKGYSKRRSIVIFLYKYDIPGKDVIQKTGFHNYSTDVDYDDMLIYSVSLEKISDSSIIELDRALKLLSSFDMEPYLNDKSNLIKEAAVMLCDYDKSERAQMERDARNKQELEYYTRINAAAKEGLEKGLAEGREKGLAQGREEGIAQGREEGKKVGERLAKEEMIKTMYSNGFNAESIAKALSLDLEYILSILK